MFWKLIAKFLSTPAVAKWLIKRAKRTPYAHIVKDGVLYMERYWLFNPYPASGASGADRTKWQFPISIRIHHITSPDNDRHLHDHPWNARTILLHGWYVEDRYYAGEPLPPNVGTPEFHEHLRRSGDTVSLNFGEYHRISKVACGGAWTLFITGKYRGTWGFDVDGSKVQWRKYLGLDR
jgi:hypothetical protein